MTTRIRSLNTQSTVPSRLKAVTLASLVVVLVGCGGGGGGGGDDAPAPTASGNAGLTDLYCAVGSLLFVLGGGCGDPTAYASCTVNDFGYCEGNELVSTGARTWPSALVPTSSLDIEPNDDFSTSSIVPFAALAPSSGPVGFHTQGTIHELDDPVDTYIFTTGQPWEVSVQLCAAPDSACDALSAGSNLDVAIAHLEIFDQFGNLLATTADDTINGNLIWRFSIDGGVPYYVRVVANVTMAQQQDYYVRVIGMRTDVSVEPELEPDLVVPNAPQLFLSNDGDLMATIDWLAPMQNSDGTALLNLQGYVLHYGDSSGGPYQFSEPLDVGLSSYVLALPDYGLWHIAITAVNAAGVESAFSNEVSVGGPPPDMP